MKTVISICVLSLFSLVSSSNAAWSSSSTLFESSISKRTNNNNIRAKLRARASPLPPSPAHHSLSLPASAEYLDCPEPGFQQQNIPEIFYYGDGRVKTRCSLLSAGGGYAYCDYDGMTGDLIGTSAVPGNEVDHCIGTRGVASARDTACRTTCAGPTAFSYALIDVYDKRVTCFFDGETGSDEEKVEFGCTFDVDSGKYISAVTPGTACRSVSVEYGTCAAGKE